MSHTEMFVNMYAALDKAMERPIANEHDQTGHLPYLCRHGHLARSCELCERDARIKQLEDAARAVVWFDWSSNDSDAVAAIERLRETLK